MKVLNLAWNGFGEGGSLAMASALEECTLTELNLSCNRVNSKGFIKICQAVGENDDLRVLKVVMPQRLQHLLFVYESVLLLTLIIMHILVCVSITLLEIWRRPRPCIVHLFLIPSVTS